MENNDLKYLQFVRFREVELWDVKRFSNSFNSFQNATKLKAILSPYVVPISKNELVRNEWSIIQKINFSGNLYLRDSKDTSGFKGNVNRIDPDTLIYSKINVRHGCIYYHPQNEIPFGVSSEYPAFKIDSNRVLGNYLVRVIQSQKFKQILNAKTTGISKARVKKDEFLDVQIPLPSLSEQQSLVSAYNTKIQQAQECETKAEEISKEIEDYLLEELGVKQKKTYQIQENTLSVCCEPTIEYCVSNSVLKENAPTYHGDEIKKEYSFLKFVRFRDIERWDCYNVGVENVNSNFQTLKLSRLIVGKPQYGASYKAVNKISDFRYIRITDINEDGFLNDDFVTAEKFDEHYLLKQDDFLIARSGNTVGKTFLYDENFGKAIFAGYLIKFVLNKDIINPLYLLAYTKSSLYKKWINSNMRVSAQPNINSQQYCNSPIIVPPLPIQNAIVAHIGELKEQIKQLKQQAKDLRENALKEFENEIFV